MKAYERLKKYMDAVGLKQSVVAEKSDIHYKTFNAILNGKRKLGADELLVICDKGLVISLEKFFNHEIQ